MRAPTLLAAVVCFGTALLAARAADPESSAAMVVERTIPLPDVAGRIDHLSLDLARERLLVAELGNHTVDVIDLRASRRIDRISGLKAPQGVAYVAASDRIVVADGGDGTVRIFRASDRSPLGAVALGSDADDIRVDSRMGHVLVGYGEGGLAVIDPVGPTRLVDIPLGAHPEGFELDGPSQRLFVNLPESGEIGVVDLGARRQIARWSVRGSRWNFPMALDPTGSPLAVVFRRPARLALIDARAGTAVAALDACGDADDVFFDAQRHRIYVSCGEGAVDVFASEAAATRRIQRVLTYRGARTSLFVPELDRLFVAAPAPAVGADAAILVLRPTP